MSKAVSRMAGVVLEWGRAAFIVLMVGFPGVGHADDRVAATDLRVERHPTQAGTYIGIMRIKNIGSTAWSNIAYQFVDNGQPIVFQIEGRSTTTPTDVRTVPPQQEITVVQSFPLSYGTHTIVGIADPGFTLGEQGAEKYNNALSRTVEVSPQLVPGVKVELLRVGNDDAPTNRWCDKNNRMLRPGSAMPVTIVGHNVTGASSVSGTIRLKNVTQNFEWAYLRDPQVTFGPTESTPSAFPVSAKPSASLTLHYLGFAAVDDVGAESPIQVCKIQVAASLSLVEVAGLTLDRAQVVANQQATVKLIVRNTTSSPLASVPWMIWVWTSQPAGGAGGGGIVGSSNTRTEVLGSGVQNVRAGASLEVAAPWAPSKIGTYYVVGQVDPQNTLAENQSERGNNRQQVTVSVATAGRSPYEIPQTQTPPAAVPRQCGICALTDWPFCMACVRDADCVDGFFCCDRRCQRR